MSASGLRIGWYGLGSMGSGMSLNLQNHLQLKNLPSLHYSNRTLSKGEALKNAGAVVERDFQDVIKSSDIIFTMISNDDVFNDLLQQAKAVREYLKNKIFVDTSTLHPDTCEEASKCLGEHDAVFVAAPVFGASAVAAAGELIFAIAGPGQALDVVRPLIINVMGRSILEMGDDVRKSSLLKITGNVLVISFMEVIAEAHVFAEQTGIGNRQLEDFLGMMFGPVLESYSNRITTGAYAPPLDKAPGFSAALACKDMNHAISIAKSHSTRLPTLENALNHLNTAREYAGECLDSSALYGTARMEAGLPFWSQHSRQGNE